MCFLNFICNCKCLTAKTMVKFIFMFKWAKCQEQGIQREASSRHVLIFFYFSELFNGKHNSEVYFYFYV